MEAVILAEIKQYGYIALFFMMAIGLFFFPVPNEVLLMTVGFLATTRYVDPFPAFLVVFSSIVLHGTILYSIGSVVSKYSPITINEESIWYTRAKKGKELLDQYGLKAAIFSYFLPFIRHAVPFSIGLSEMKYRYFAFVAFSSAFVWMSIYFFIGFFYGNTITDMSSFVEQIIYLLTFAILLFIGYRIVKQRKKRVKARKKHV